MLRRPLRPLPRRAVLAAGIALLLADAAAADTLSLPASAMPAEGRVIATWRADAAAAGTLTLEWSDGAGRLLERHEAAVRADQIEVDLPLDLRRARAPGNRVVARFRPAGGGVERRAEAAFEVPPPAGWPVYQALVWQPQTPAALRNLRQIGLTGTALIRPQEGAGPEQVRERVAAGVRWYAENLATDFYAAYHRWTPNKPVDALYRAAKDAYRANPASTAAFLRTPSLSDPDWLRSVRLRLTDVARRFAPQRPLYYSLGDETGIADLAAAWDFDLSPASLDGMRLWLRERHGSLDALNAAWGARFASWGAVMPALTDAAIRDEAAVPSWMEWKAWMDVSFARALRVGAEAVHRGDPAALAGIEGAQVPGWGGYDYGLISSAVDVMEIYDFGNALEIAQSLNPDLLTLTINATGDDAGRRQLWRHWLLGARGVILWDETGDVIRPDGAPGPRGEALAPALRELGDALGTQRFDMQPEPGDVAILYSQASFRLRWLLDRRADPKSWTTRDADAENAEDAWRVATRRAAAGLAALGAQARWVTSDALAAGVLDRNAPRVLLLPHSIALADAELMALRRFVAGGGLLLADRPPGERDALGRARQALPLEDLAAIGRLRFPALLREDAGALGEVADLLEGVGASLPLRLTRTDGEPARDVEVRLYRRGGVLLAGVLRTGAKTGADEGALRLQLRGRLWVRDARSTTPAVLTDSMPLSLGPADPALLVLSADPLPGISVAGPRTATPGELVAFRLSLDGASPARSHVVHVSVRDPAGREQPWLAETVRLGPAGLEWRLPLARNDPQGAWRVRATDALGGGVAEAVLQVR